MKQFNKEKIALINTGIAEFLGWRHFDKCTSVDYVDFYGDQVDVFENVWTEGEDLIEGVYSYHYNIDKTIKYHYLLKFHESWDALMPVIQKIAKLRFYTRFHISGFPILVTIIGCGGMNIRINEGNVAGEEYKGERGIVDTMNFNAFAEDESSLCTEIELAWIAIARFLEWYEKNKENIR